MSHNSPCLASNGNQRKPPTQKGLPNFEKHLWVANQKLGALKTGFALGLPLTVIQMGGFLLLDTHLVTQTLLGLPMEDPDPPLDTPEVFWGVKTWLFEGPASIGSVWEGSFGPGNDAPRGSGFSRMPRSTRVVSQEMKATRRWLSLCLQRRLSPVFVQW